jgi:SAM-dependent methyltransferase
MLANKPPLPPLHLRRLVGPVDDASFDNPHGHLVFGDHLPADCNLNTIYQSVFDFGCGCGRHARQFMLQSKPPEYYVGIDISRELIDWCEQHLTPHNPNFRFQHHDVYSVNYAPTNSKVRARPIELPDCAFTFINAHSVFTHLFEDQATHYLSELARLAALDGLVRVTFFAMNREWFPPLAEHQHSIFLSETDLTQAVYFDWRWLQQLIAGCGLWVASVGWPKRGGQFHLFLTKRSDKGTSPFDVWPAPGTVPGF